MTTIEKRGIYTDLMRKFREEGHAVYIISPCERREGKPTTLYETEGVKILSVRTLNVQKTNVIEKGLGQVSIEYLYKRAIHKYFKDVAFDIILYSTPPITLMGVVKDMKRKNPQAITYLLLKDIFPQNALDLGMMTEKGLKGFLYRHFRKQEINLYKESDYIGCMSPANVKYLLEHNPNIDPKRVEVAPNSIELVKTMTMTMTRDEIRKKYGLPTDKPIFIYGGNLGKPQGIPFLMKCLEANKHRTDCHFLVVGTGTYLPMLQEWYQKQKALPSLQGEDYGGASVTRDGAGDRLLSITVMKGLPKDEYDQLVQACDVGLIFLDYRFTIPNYPSRLLSYLEYKMPIIACTDPNCDMGAIAEENGYGLWAPSNDVTAFTYAVDKILQSDIKDMGERGYDFLCKNYLVDNTYNAIMAHASLAQQ